MACPFGFSGPPPDGADGDISDCCSDDVLGGSRKGASLPDEGDRFNYDKDPVSWFFQNQIKSEEEFQARKSELRAAARARLDQVFEKKGKRLVVDSDDDDWSIDGSELSAWDSDVASITSMSSAVREWREEAHFAAPAEAALQLALWATAAFAAHTCWTSFGAMNAVNRFWGIIHHGWLPTASFATSAVLTATALCCWLSLGRTGKRCLLGYQVALQGMYAITTGLALVAFVLPTALDAQLKDSAACASSARDSSASRLCQYLPAIEDEVKGHVAALLLGCAGEAACCVVVLAASAFYAWELGHVEKRATKHKRRRRHRKHGIPWDKIKVEDMGPVTTCGTAGAGKAPGAKAGGGGCPFSGAGGSGGAPAAEAGGAKAAGGGCPFASMAGGGGAAAAAAAAVVNGKDKKDN